MLGHGKQRRRGDGLEDGRREMERNGRVNDYRRNGKHVYMYLCGAYRDLAERFWFPVRRPSPLPRQSLIATVRPLRAPAMPHSIFAAGFCPLSTRSLPRSAQHVHSHWPHPATLGGPQPHDKQIGRSAAPPRRPDRRLIIASCGY